MIKPRADFRATVAKADLSLRAFAALAEVSYDTLMGALLNNQKHRRGGVSERTAWKLARGFAKHTGVTEDAAFEQLFEEVEHPSPDGRHIRQVPV